MELPIDLYTEKVPLDEIREEVYLWKNAMIFFIEILSAGPVCRGKYTDSSSEFSTRREMLDCLYRVPELIKQMAIVL